MGGTVTVFDPQGHEGEIPQANLAAFVKAGGKPSVTIQAPDGTKGYVPADRTQDAIKAGGKLIPIEEQPAKGFWSEAGSALWDDLKGMAAGSAKLAPKIMSAASGGDAGPLGEAISDQASTMRQNWKTRTEAGEGLPYRVGAAANETLGVNVTGEEQAAKEGNPGAVLGHAAAVPVALAVTAGLAKGAEIGAPKALAAASDAADLVKTATPKQAAQAIGGASGAVAGHGPLSVPGAYYGAKGAGNVVEGILGKERANAPLIAPSKPFNAGAPLPEVPDPALLKSQGLAEGGKPVASPSDALGQIPVEQHIPGVNVRPNIERVMSLSDMPPKAVTQAIQELGPKATIADLTKRAGELINEGLGGKGLEPNVPIKNQGGIITPTASDAAFARNYPNEDMKVGATPDAQRAWQESAGFKVEPAEDIGAKVRSQMPAVPRGSSIPEGHTAVESSAVKSFKYDPEAKEIDINTPGGGRYIYGDIAPEQAKAFAEGNYQGRGKGPASVGKAWADIRKNGTLVAKIVNGKRIPVRPILSDEDAISPDEWRAGQEIDTHVEGTPR